MPENGDLHVQSYLDVLKVLIFLHLDGQFIQKTLDLVILSVHLSTMSTLHIFHELCNVRNLLIEIEVGSLQISNLAVEVFNLLLCLL